MGEKELHWDIYMPRMPDSSAAATSHYHLFRSVQNVLSGEAFHSLAEGYIRRSVYGIPVKSAEDIIARTVAAATDEIKKPGVFERVR
ncbi:hypothetical protein AVEN_217818-1 [Araneus ventricosus]|uniref:Uncharacterized protein n=1 Tax=Araneus ventricosus TaxID=182803 RepID=A0A4Y2LX47_ARAVE|nr:hypothetical protein AVEN_217818-1 [Araneus ventricosus]